VLRNLAGVRSLREMQRLESEALVAATNRAIDETDADQQLTAADICRWHRHWLGDLYAWAGQYRNVNLTKGGFMFAAAEQVPRLMGVLERGPLGEHTPCLPDEVGLIAHRLAVVHAELVLIHPFRDGNGRCARLVATIMALQAGLPALDFGGIRGQAKRRYIQAIHDVVGRDYEPMAAVFRAVIRRTLRAHGGRPR
jgi:cell filamentation protein